MRPARGSLDPARSRVIRYGPEKGGATMARRWIGQEKLWGDRAVRPVVTSLDDVAALVDWTELDQLLAGISASSKGEPGWPPLFLLCHKPLA
jgi:hypothetical protein